MSFVKELTNEAKKHQIIINQEQAAKLKQFAELLKEENNKYNLTSLTEEEDIINKHFVDSMQGWDLVKDKEKIIDIGSGAGFPAIPLKIMGCGECLLLDSSKKKIGFLNKAFELLGVKGIKAEHMRIEDAANLKEYRHSFDIALARAVAPLNVLLEYAMPLLQKGGRLIAYKGKNVKEEIELAQNAMKIMKAEIEDTISYCIDDRQRYILSIKSLSKEHRGYPRAQNKPKKQPL